MMSKKEEKGKPCYEAPRVMRLGALARGQSDACSTGSNAQGGCRPTGNSADIGCSYGNSAANVCGTNGNSAGNACSAFGEAAFGNCGTGDGGPAPPPV